MAIFQTGRIAAQNPIDIDAELTDLGMRQRRPGQQRRGGELFTVAVEIGAGRPDGEGGDDARALPPQPGQRRPQGHEIEGGGGDIQGHDQIAVRLHSL